MPSNKRKWREIIRYLSLEDMNIKEEDKSWSEAVSLRETQGQYLGLLWVFFLKLIAKKNP